MVLCIVLEELRLHASTYAPGSDYWEHSAVLHALIESPWHPLNPHLANRVSSPRFGPVSVLNALISRAFGLDAPAGLSLAAVANTLLFVSGIWLFFRSYFRDPRAGLYGLLVMLGGSWEAWTFTSVYQPKVLLSVACYPWLAAFGLTLLGLALTLRGLRAERPHWLVWLGLVLWPAVVLLTHQLTGMMALSALCLLIVTERGVPLRRRAWVLGAATLGCALAAFWPLYSVFGLLAGGKQDAGWVGRSVTAAAHGAIVEQRHRFYRPRELVPALGLGLLGVAFLPYFFLRWRRLFVGLGVLSMLGPFLINAFIPLPLGHRFLLLAVFFLQVAVVWLLLVLTPGSAEFCPLLDRRGLRLISLLLVWGLLLTFAYHNVQRTRREWAYFAGYARRGESPLLRYARRVAVIAGKRAVILGDPVTLWPIPTFGPKVVALHHENPFVADQDQRDQDVTTFFTPLTTDEVRGELLRQYGVTHVIVNRGMRGPIGRFLAAKGQREELPAGFALYTLTSAPH
jgi:hypothetical protein